MGMIKKSKPAGKKVTKTLGKKPSTKKSVISKVGTVARAAVQSLPGGGIATALFDVSGIGQKKGKAGVTGGRRHMNLSNDRATRRSLRRVAAYARRQQKVMKTLAKIVPASVKRQVRRGGYGSSFGSAMRAEENRR